MKNWLIKSKVSVLPLSIFVWSIFALPIKSMALEYTALEPDAFSGFAGDPNGGLSSFLSQAFQFGLAIAAALAVVMIVWGGVEIMLSESLFKKEDGKKKVWDAIWGLLLALVSWLILYTINPEILNWDSVLDRVPLQEEQYQNIGIDGVQS